MSIKEEGGKAKEKEWWYSCREGSPALGDYERRDTLRYANSEKKSSQPKKKKGKKKGIPQRDVLGPLTSTRSKKSREQKDGKKGGGARLCMYGRGGIWTETSSITI